MQQLAVRTRKLLRGVILRRWQRWWQPVLRSLRLHRFQMRQLPGAHEATAPLLSNVGLPGPSCGTMKAGMVVREDSQAARALQVFIRRKAHGAWCDVRLLQTQLRDAGEMWLPGLSFRLCCWLSHPANGGLFLARAASGASGERRRTPLRRTCSPGTVSAPFQSPLRLGWRCNCVKTGLIQNGNNNKLLGPITTKK